MSIRATTEWNPFTGQIEPIRPAPVMDEIPRRWDPFTGRMEPIDRGGSILNIDPFPVLRLPQTRLPGQTGFEFGDGFALGTDPLGGGIINNLAGRYGLWGGLGGLIGGAIGAFTKGRK